MRKRFTVVGLGEVLWDVFPDGPRFGGAPANFACHAAMLGADAFMVSQVGSDELGDQAIAELRDHGVHTDAVGRTTDRPTGTVKVKLDAAGKPTFTITDNVAWDAIPWSFPLASLAGRADAVCFGTLAQRHETSRQTIRQFMKGTGPDCLCIFDVNLRPPFVDRQRVLDSLPLANVLKLNDEELPILAGMTNVTGSETEMLTQLRCHYPLRLIALTRGSKGAMLLSDAGFWQGAAPPVQVRDTVGAGDAFTAAMTVGLLRGDDLGTIGRHACEVAAYVCTQSGAVPRLPEELRG